MTLLIFIKISITASGGAGSTIFYKKHAKSECWNEDDIAKLRARKTFEDLVPVKIAPHEVDVDYIKEELRYFRRALRFVDRIAEPRKAILLKQALADTIGAHLRKDILPTVRFAFYAGYIPYRNARQLHDLYEEQKKYLNSQGLGWKTPDRIPKWSNLTVSKILIDSGTFFDPCSDLVTKRDSSSCIYLPIPKFDDDYEPTAIALPFKSGGLVSLTSPNSNNILLKYYTAASRCILGSSPEKCRHSDFLTFNNEMWHWMKREVAPHLVDEKLYPAYSGILRIAAAVQTYGKGLTRRNLYDYPDAGVTKWHPWQKLTNSYIYVNADWTPHIYICVVILAAISVYLVQICYNYICDDSCQCRSAPVWRENDPAVGYGHIQTSYPVILPNSAEYHSDKKRAKSTTPRKLRSASLGSIKTQKVFDFNENTEKFMSVLLSENEQYAEQANSSSEGTSDIDPGRYSDQEDECKDGSKSPPKLETSISQVKVEKTPRQKSRTRTPMYSTATTSTMIRGDSYQPTLHTSDTVWTGTESSSSSSSITTTSSKSRRSSRSLRDLAWARRVVSKGSLRRKDTSSRTDMDNTSVMTPPSQR